MGRSRWASVVAVSAGLAALPACAIHLGSKTVETESTAADAPLVVQSPPAAATEFAALPRRPGERVPLHPEAQEAVTVAAPAVDAPPRPSVPEPLPPITVPAPPDPPVVAAVREYANDRPDRALEHLKSLDAPSQELMLQLIPVLVRAGQTPMAKASPHDVGVMAGELERARDALGGRVPLFVATACFCHDVKNYGRYDPYPERHAFRPGSLVWLYTEVRNVPSEPAAAPTGVEGYATKLACSLHVTDAAGATVPVLSEVKEDFTRSPVRDYFLAFRFPVPPRPGAYTVRFEVKDPKTGRSVSRQMPLAVQ